MRKNTKKKNKMIHIPGKPKGCDIADPRGTQKTACDKRKARPGMYCKSCSLNIKMGV